MGNFKVSVIIPIYDVEKYLEETLESVIHQSIGFEKNIELILMNDGSPDNSEKICLEYRDKYPNNIKYIKQKNQGVSKARNNALKEATSDYISFLDSDDIIDKHYYKKGIDMLEKHEDIPFVSFRIKCFDKFEGFHPLDYKYTGNKIIDLDENPDYVQLSSSSVIFRRSALSDEPYDYRLKFSEDAKMLGEILIEYNKYGIISDTLYYYRKRVDDSSAVQRAQSNLSWYFDTLREGYLYLCKLSKKKKNCVTKYIQSLVLYELRWRVSERYNAFLNPQEQLEYENIIKELISYCDVDSIVKQIDVNLAIKIKELMLDDKDVFSKLSYKNNTVNYLDSPLISPNLTFINIEIFEIKNGRLLIEGHVNNIPKSLIEVFYKVNGGKEKKAKVINRPFIRSKFLNEDAYDIYGFAISVDVDSTDNVEVYAKWCGKRVNIKQRMISNSKLRNGHGRFYYDKKKMIICKRNTFYINHKPCFLTMFFKEIMFLLILLLKLKIKQFIFRFLYWLTKPIYGRKNIWLISDRYDVAGDNGEAFFRYLNKKNDKKISPYFVISKKYKDIDRLKEIGNVVTYQSLKYKILFMHSSFIISSHSEPYTTNCFGKSLLYYADLFRFKYVFLQHGITQNSLGAWLNKYRKNISLIVTTNEKERLSMMDETYHYGEDVVKLTGMARYDRLMEKADVENKILIMPTWRGTLAGSVVPGTQTRLYNKMFKESDYYKFYNGLLNDSDLLSLCRKNNYKIKFVIHPSLSAQSVDFKSNDVVEVVKRANYAEEFKTSKLLITDYSSVFFDFAYLNKPVIYTAFDEETFYQNHIFDSGYFDKRRDGFGPVTTNLEDAKREIIKLVENGCKIDKKYKKRIDSFYRYHDNKNSERIYQAMKNI